MSPTCSVSRSTARSSFPVGGRGVRSTTSHVPNRRGVLGVSGDESARSVLFTLEGSRTPRRTGSVSAGERCAFGHPRTPRGTNLHDHAQSVLPAPCPVRLRPCWLRRYFCCLAGRNTARDGSSDRRWLLQHGLRALSGCSDCLPMRPMSMTNFGRAAEWDSSPPTTAVARARVADWMRRACSVRSRRQVIRVGLTMTQRAQPEPLPHGRDWVAQPWGDFAAANALLVGRRSAHHSFECSSGKMSWIAYGLDLRCGDLLVPQPSIPDSLWPGWILQPALNQLARRTSAGIWAIFSGVR